MRFIFEPASEKNFKEQAVGRTIETVVVNTITEEEVKIFTRNVRKTWEQTCKNNIETDHRIKELKREAESDNYIVHTRIL